jgi:predicted thioesterase
MLLIIFLEEVKLNYVQEFSDEDLETILEQTRLLHSQSTEISPVETMNPRRLP